LRGPGRTPFGGSYIGPHLLHRFARFTGISSYSAKRNAIEGDKHFTQSVADGTKRPAEIEFADGDVYNIDIIVSTGTGKTRQLETRTTIYRKTDATYLLKLKASRAVFSEVSSKFGVFAFSLRYLVERDPATAIALRTTY